MNDRIRVERSESGCWQVKRGEYVVHIYSPHMWRQAWEAARAEAAYHYLGIERIEMYA